MDSSNPDEFRLQHLREGGMEMQHSGADTKLFSTFNEAVRYARYSTGSQIAMSVYDEGGRLKAMAVLA